METVAVIVVAVVVIAVIVWIVDKMRPANNAPPTKTWTKPPVQARVTTIVSGSSGRYVNGEYSPIDTIDVGNGIWNVESEGSPGYYYNVIIDDEGWVCSCPDYERGRQGWKRGVRVCKHIGLITVKADRKPALKQVIRSTGEIRLVNDAFVDWYVNEGIYERHWSAI